MKLYFWILFLVLVICLFDTTNGKGSSSSQSSSSSSSASSSSAQSTNTPKAIKPIKQKKTKKFRSANIPTIPPVPKLKLVKPVILQKQCVKIEEYKGGYTAVGCGVYTVTKPCEIIEGDLMAPYPDCCPKTKC